MDSPIETTRHTFNDPPKKYNQKVWALQCPKISNAKIPSPEAGVYSKSNKRLGCWSPRRKHRCSWPKNGYAFFGCKNWALTSPKIVPFSDEVYVHKEPPKSEGGEHVHQPHSKIVRKRPSRPREKCPVGLVEIMKHVRLWLGLWRQGWLSPTLWYTHEPKLPADN